MMTDVARDQRVTWAFPRGTLQQPAGSPVGRNLGGCRLSSLTGRRFAGNGLALAGEKTHGQKEDRGYRKQREQE